MWRRGDSYDGGGAGERCKEGGEVGGDDGE